MGLLGKLLGTAIDVLATPIAIAKDVFPGGGGYIDGNSSKTAKKIAKVADDLREVRDDIEDL